MPRQGIVMALIEYVYRMRNSCGTDTKSTDDGLIDEVCKLWVLVKPNDDPDVYREVSQAPAAQYEWPNHSAEYEWFIKYFPLAIIEKECAKYR